MTAFLSLRIVAPASGVHLSDLIKRQGLAVDQLLPLHGRMVPLSELHKAIGQSH